MSGQVVLRPLQVKAAFEGGITAAEIVGQGKPLKRRTTDVLRGAVEIHITFTHDQMIATIVISTHPPVLSTTVIVEARLDIARGFWLQVRIGKSRKIKVV